MKKILLVIPLFLFFSCSNSTTGTSNENPCLKQVNGFLEPLAESNFWKMQPRSTDRPTYKLFIEKMTNIKINNNSYTVGISRRKNLDTNAIGFMKELLWNGPGGVYTLGRIAYEDSLIIDPQLLYKYPAEVGDQWKVPLFRGDGSVDSLSIAGMRTYTLVAKDEPFVTSADTFRTNVYYHYLSEGSDVLANDHYFEFFAPGIGIVGTLIYSSPDTTYSFELTKHRSPRYEDKLSEYCLH